MPNLLARRYILIETITRELKVAHLTAPTKSGYVGAERVG